MGGSPVQPAGCIGTINTAPDLQTTRPGSQGLGGGIFVAGAEHDDMAASKIILPVEFCKPGWSGIGGKIGLQPIRVTVNQR